MQREKIIKSHWELLPHGADIGVRGIGSSKEEAFEQAAVALTAVITDPTSVAAKDEVEVTCNADDDELLLVDWLNALIYEMATRKMLFGRFEVHIEDCRLRVQRCQCGGRSRGSRGPGEHRGAAGAGDLH